MAWQDRADRINHEGAKTLWEQVAVDIAADIDAAVLPAGARLPNELELAEIYGVARVTVRRAIADLVDRGLVVVVRGRGTFVVE